MLLSFFWGVSSAFSQNADSLKVVSNAKDSINISTIQEVDTLNEYVDEMISFAKKFMGTPYHYGGGTPSGFDCSGFINYVMNNFGIQLSRSSPGMAEFGKTVKLADAKPGDLMFFSGRGGGSSSVGHVAMIIEVSSDGVIKFIHASTSRGVTVDTFNNSKYYVPRYIKTKHLDYGQDTKLPKVPVKKN